MTEEMILVVMALVLFLCVLVGRINEDTKEIRAWVAEQIEAKRFADEQKAHDTRHMVERHKRLMAEEESDLVKGIPSGEKEHDETQEQIFDDMVNRARRRLRGTE